MVDVTIGEKKESDARVSDRGNVTQNGGPKLGHKATFVDSVDELRVQSFLPAEVQLLKVNA
jgi:hypothetical protein